MLHYLREHLGPLENVRLILLNESGNADAVPFRSRIGYLEKILLITLMVSGSCNLFVPGIVADVIFLKGLRGPRKG